MRTNDPAGAGPVDQLVRPGADALPLLERLRQCWPATPHHRDSLHIEAAQEIERLRAELAEWQKLRDQVTLHVSLLRGFPAKLPRAVFLHLAGDEEPKW